MNKLENELFEKWREMFVTEFYKEFNKVVPKNTETTPENILRDDGYSPAKGPNVPFKTKVAIVEGYLFDGAKLSELAELYKVNYYRTLRWADDDEVLSDIASRRGLTVQKINELRVKRPVYARGIPYPKVRSNWSPGNVDKAFDRMHKELGRKPSYDEFAARFKGAMVAIQDGRYKPEIRKWTQYLMHRGFDMGGWAKDRKDTSQISLEEKVLLVENYLFVTKGIVKLCEQFGVLYSVVHRRYSKDPEVLRGVATKRGINYDEVVGRKNEKVRNKISKSSRRTPFETKVDIIDDYLFGDEVTTTIAKSYDVSDSSIVNWRRNNQVLMEIARRRSIDYSEVVGLRDRREKS